jgi:multidrug efflux pump subunit AcrA (membrane-fusion protein)
MRKLMWLSLLGISVSIASQQLERRSAIGVVVTGVPIDISAQRAGKISTILVSPGQKVETGQLLFSLARAEIDTEIAVESAALDRAQAENSAAQAAVNQSKAEAARQAKAPGLFTQAQKDGVQFEIQMRQARAAAADANVKELAARVQKSRLALSDVVIRASGAGTVAAVLRDVGETVNPGEVVIRLEQQGSPRVRFAIENEHAQTLKISDPLIIRDARQQLAMAQILSLAPDIDAPSGLVFAEALQVVDDHALKSKASSWYCQSTIQQASGEDFVDRANAKPSPPSDLQDCRWKTGTPVTVELLENQASKVP